jgi:hypothetical protein
MILVYLSGVCCVDGHIIIIHYDSTCGRTILSLPSEFALLALEDFSCYHLHSSLLKGTLHADRSRRVLIAALRCFYAVVRGDINISSHMCCILLCSAPYEQ